MAGLRRTTVGVVLILAFALALTLVVAACGNKQSGSSSDKYTGEPNVIRLTLAPDPVWDWLKDQGIRQEMEQAAGMTVIDSSTWDEFGIFAGGHADVISTASYEIPLLEKQTGATTTTFGKYNIDRSVIVTRADSPYQTLEDLKGKDISVYSAVSTTIMWGAYVKKMYGLDFRTGGGDYNLIVSDPQEQADLVVNGDCEAAIALPEFFVEPLRTGKLKIIYDGKTNEEMFSDLVVPGSDHPMINIFLAHKEWVDARPKEAAFFLSLWERGLQEWRDHRDEIIATYPQHFAVESPEDIAWIQDYLNKKDWFTDSVYMPQTWIDTELKLFPFLKENGMMAQDAAVPYYQVMTPDSSSPSAAATSGN
jgi:ABC-type nitrate/sulfonate/bicarbonate transport system substrate-binding protein